MRDFLKAIENKVLIYDGSKGYMLQKLGLKGGECGELWNVNNSEAVKEVYRQYKDAGADVIQTNTFTGSRVHLEKYSLENRTYELNYQGAKLARDVAGEDVFVAASIGPTGQLFEPYGELTFQKAYDIYKEQIKALADGGVDIINFETFTDIAEMRAALLSAKESTNLPVICSMAYEANGRTLMGTEPFLAVKILLSLGADMVGVNCSFGAEHMLGIVKKIFEAGGGCLSVKPNAGLPEVTGDTVCYRQTPEDFAELAAEFASYGAVLIGGCCGTTPEFIKALKAKLRGLKPMGMKAADNDAISSSTAYLPVSQLAATDIGKLCFLIDNIVQAQIEKGDFTYIEDIVMDYSQDKHSAVLISIDGADSDNEILAKTVKIAQTMIKLPLILETSNPISLEKALLIYNGVAGVALKGKDAALNDKINKIAKKYGSIVI